MAQVALQYGNTVRVVDSSAVNILSPEDLFPDFNNPTGKVLTVQNAVDAGLINESSDASQIQAAQQIVTQQNASTILSQVQAGNKITSNPNNQALLNSMVQTLTAAGIDESDAQLIVQKGITPSESVTSSAPLNTGGGAGALNTGSQLPSTIGSFQVPPSPFTFIPDQSTLMNWAILFALIAIAIWIIVEVFQ